MQKEYYERNKEKIKFKNKEYRIKNKEKIQELIGLYSEFEDKKTGEKVQNRDYTKLSGKWLKGTYAKAKNEYIQTFGKEQFENK